MSGTGFTNPSDETSGGTNADGLDASTLDWVFNVLADDRRRSVVGALATESDNVASIDDLADHLLAYDRTADDRERMMVTLHHDTLPRLEDAGLVDLDRRTDTVRYRRHELVEDLLDVIADENE